MGFGKALQDVMTEWRAQPTLRQKRAVPAGSTDLELFQSLSLGDVWGDAALPEVYRYLRANPNLTIPDSWHVAIKEFEDSLAIAHPPP